MIPATLRTGGLSLVAAAMLALAGCVSDMAQTAKPPLSYGKPPEHAIPARYDTQDVRVTYTETSERPKRGWLLVERYPGDERPSVVPAFPYAAYTKFYGVIEMVYPETFRGRVIVTGGS